MSSSTSPRALEYGPVTPSGGFFARDLQVGDMIRVPTLGTWRRIVAIEDSPHGERAIEVAGDEVLISDLVDDEIFEILPGTFIPVDVVLEEAQHQAEQGYLDEARAQAILAYSHRDATDQQRALAADVLATVHRLQAATR